jgi:hypothetical protein
MEPGHSLQNDINNRVHWSDKWLLKFNKSKCKYVHLGHATNTKHKMGEHEINQVTEENDKDFESFNHVGSQSSVLKCWQYKIFQAFCVAQMLYNFY